MTPKRNSEFVCTCSLSIVSHKQMHLITDLLQDLETYRRYIREIILTVNLPEQVDLRGFKNNIQIVENAYPRGFGANHNAAFDLSTGTFFFVLNPDLRIGEFDFNGFLKKLSIPQTGVLTPMIVNSDIQPEDHVRAFPTLNNLLARRLLRRRSLESEVISGRPTRLETPYWIAGMFMAFRNDIFRRTGFDERYFMYLEDVDLCAQLHCQGLNIVVDHENLAVHDAQRESHRSLRLFFAHCDSYFKYFFKWGGKQIG